MTSSATRVPYDLRPSKQVERRIFVDALQELSQVGFPIRTYTYIGMGGIFYTDFIMFHKYLGIDNLVSVERDLAIEARIRFNQPFASVGLVMDEVGNVIAGMNRDTRYLLWLDYDEPLTTGASEDIRLAVDVMRSSSLLLVTIPIFPGRSRSKEETFRYYEEGIGDYFAPEWGQEDFTPNRIMRTLADAFIRMVRSGLQGRSRIYFEILFYFRYSDGRDMLSIGGMVCDPHDRQAVRKCNFGGRSYICRSIKADPLSIEVPILTRKERAHADACMPSKSRFLRSTLGFSVEEIRTYRSIYRFLPSYGELLIG